MRILLLSLLILIEFNSFSQTKYSVNGSLDSILTGEIWLLKSYTDSTIIDTTQIVNGKFSFKGNLKNPVNARLDIKDGKIDYFKFVLEPLPQSILGKGYPLSNWKIKGGKLNDGHKKYLTFLNVVDIKIKAISYLLQIADKQNVAKLDSLSNTLATFYKQKDSLLEIYLNQNSNDIFTAFLIQDLYNQSSSLTLLKKRFYNLTSAVQQSHIGKSIYNTIEEYENPKKYKTAPVINQKDTSGNIFKLSSLKGKYVLVDFWASWCNPCRELNPDLVKLYYKHKEDNFTILSVSFDEDSNKWKSAIVEDGLTWYHVSELNGWQNSTSKYYKINYIPQNVLINPQGKIIAKNLGIDELEKKLTILFGNRR